jgi:hypothetical protein
VEEALLEYLSQSPGGESRIDPSEGQQLTPDQRPLEVLAHGVAVVLEEGSVGFGQGSIGIEDGDIAARLLQGVIPRRDAPAGHARQVRDLLDQRGAVGRSYARQRLQPRRPEERRAAAAARKRHADEQVALGNRHLAWHDSLRPLHGIGLGARAPGKQE